MQTTPQTRPKKPAAKAVPDQAHLAHLADVKVQFQQAGITITSWASANGFHRMTVVDVLRGHRKGNHGEAHRVAVALGLKRGGRVVDVKLFKPAVVQV